MRLKRLEIETLPGIEKGFVLDEIDQGVNLITGANGIGKSSLIRALKYLLNEIDKNDPTKLNISAVLQGKTDCWEVQRYASTITWEIDGKSTDRPLLPEYHQLCCYWLTLENLLVAEQIDEDFVAELKRSLNGGFDLPALREDEAFKVTARHGRNESTSLTTAQRELKGVNDTYEETRRIEANLPAQEEALQTAKAANIKTDLLQSTLDLLKASQECVSIEGSMAEFPEHMKELSGDETSRLENIISTRNGYLESKDGHQTDHETATADLGKTRLAADLESLDTLQTEIDEHDSLRVKIITLDTTRGLKKEALIGATVNATTALESLGGEGTTVPKLDAQSLSDAQSLARALESAHEEKAWLQKGQPVSGAKTAIRQGTLALIGFGGLIATTAGFLTQVWVAALGGSIVLATAFWTMFGPRNEEDGYRQNKLKENKDTLKKLEKEKKSLAERLGFDPSLTSLGLDVFTRKADEYTKFYREQKITEGEIAALGAEIDPLVDQVFAFLKKWDTSLSETADWKTFEQHLTDLKARRNKAADAVRKIEAAEKEIEGATVELTGLAEQEAEIYNNARLESGNLTELKNRCNRLLDWKNLHTALVEAKVTERDRKKPINGHEDLLSRVVKNDRQGLESELEQAKELSGNLEDLQESLTTTKNLLDAAGNDSKLKNALSAKETARTKLDAKYQKALIADTAEMLLDTVQEQCRNEHEPKVFKEARELFLKFTHHKFDLDLDESKGFTARDLKVHLKPLRNLDELSSATRMQLLLAMRVAWTLHLEQGREPLPLFLDEALTTADHERFGEVARTLEELASKDGRQIFYLCARKQEVDYWEQSTGKRPYHIDLNAVRSVENTEEEVTYALSEPMPIPRPDGLTPEEYAKKLKVPAIGPQQPMEGIHIFHLLRDDLDLLHELIEGMRITTLGQFESWLKTVATSDQRDRLQGRSAVAGLWTEAWTQGRGKLVDRIALENADTPLIDLVSELSDSLNGDGTELIASLRERSVSGFGPQRTDSLEKWLEDNGYIDSREQLDLVGRERFVHMGSPQTGSETDTKEIVRWLEAGHKEL